MSQFEIQKNPQDLNPEQVLDLYHLIGGKRPDISLEDIQKVFNQSSLVVTAKIGDQLAGWIRCLSDTISSTWIPEMVAHPEFITFGVEEALLDAVVTEYKHTTIYYQTMYDSFSQKVTLFNRFGVKPLSNLVVCARAATP